MSEYDIRLVSKKRKKPEMAGQESRYRLYEPNQDTERIA